MRVELQPLSEQPGTGPHLAQQPIFFMLTALKRTTPILGYSLHPVFSFILFISLIFSNNFWTYQYKYEWSCWGGSLATPTSPSHMIHKLLWDGREGKKRRSSARSKHKCHTQDSYS